MFKAIARKLVPAADKLVPVEFIQKHFGNFTPIFMLHRLEHPDYGILGQSPSSIRKILSYFRKQGYRAISLEELGKHLVSGKTLPSKTAVFTVDDGFIDHHDIAAPLFSEFDIPATFFLIADFINGDLWPWDDQLSYLFLNAPQGTYQIPVGTHTETIRLSNDFSRILELRRIRENFKTEDNTHLYANIRRLYKILDVSIGDTPPDQYKAMSWMQARNLVKSGHRVAAHSCSHRILSKLNDLESEEEIMRSIHMVSERIPGASPVFAYPTGRDSDFTRREVEFLKRSDVISTVSTIHGTLIHDNVQDETALHMLPRFSMPDTQPDFMKCLSWIEYVRHKINHSLHLSNRG